ncbi:SNF2 family N-terminal domain [Musa troglodytarum]|uniref:SNF2 family N-terminal domain n=1 Tax=Musa troglodytarum TaxID=320322 RepID=A0A9E7G961_9LILI|nr:SNF2 family N-terminal domain [Musa troglodytarum]
MSRFVLGLVENELPEKIERLVRCEASAYQKLLMKRVEENLGSLGNYKVDSLLPKHFLPPIIRLCGKLEMLDRLLPKLKATGHRPTFTTPSVNGDADNPLSDRSVPHSRRLRVCTHNAEL